MFMSFLLKADIVAIITTHSHEAPQRCAAASTTMNAIDFLDSLPRSYYCSDIVFNRGFSCSYSVTAMHHQQTIFIRCGPLVSGQ